MSEHTILCVREVGAGEWVDFILCVREVGAGE